jgi:D-sedoheptulose 7-phosphate isomerase
MNENKFQQAAQDAATMYQQMTAACHADLAKIAEACARAFRDGNKLLFCGNGGSAAEAQHLATEFVVRLSSVRERRALCALSLSTDTSLLTACSNDYGFDRIFSRQIEAHLVAGDIVILLSTSGKSLNLLEAARATHAHKGTVVSFLGRKVTPLDELSDFALHIPSDSGQHVQEGHLFCGHLLVEMIEDLLFGAAK